MTLLHSLLWGATRVMTAVLMLVGGGCIQVGRTPIYPATHPDGARVAVRVYGESSDRTGELFAVDSIGVIIKGAAASHPGLQRLHWSLRFPMDVEGLGGDYDVRAGVPMTARKRARIALVSRFPQGLDGDLLARVLSELGQSALIEVGGAGAPEPEKSAISLDSLTRATAVATEKFADRDAAVRAGYRRIGTDFPGMGEHWLSPSVLLSGAIDPARPTMLAYATIDGRPRLNGVGFVATTRGGAAVQAPGWPDVWHEHSGLLDEESGPRTAQALAPSGGTDTATHVWVLHIWTRLENPGGRYAPDNWALPFARLGVAPPPTERVDAALALSLLVGGDGYLRGVLSDAGLLAKSSAVDSLIASARRQADSLTVSRPLRAGQIDDLGQVWRSLALAVTQRLGGDAARFFEPVHSGHTAHGGH